ncbi:hypothetical protein ANN_04840 [Periplaneta americana]|uniref:Reverse transcriptase domain-containing protein n=1 Tax=Periplaneta americana TaxID=6978 RepID=A0ABQ8TBY7_PERAM|nr:hypothetical protein ANN_04840 [Periplaneta americana]
MDTHSYGEFGEVNMEDFVSVDNGLVTLEIRGVDDMTADHTASTAQEEGSNEKLNLHTKRSPWSSKYASKIQGHHAITHTKLHKRSRKIDIEKLERNKDKIDEENQLIIQEEIDKGVTQITEIMQACTSPNKERKAQPWFDKDCYNKRKETITALHRARTTNQTEKLTRNIPECQCGFRKGRGTLQAANYLLEQIEDALRHVGNKYFAVFIDYKKAFDLINREILLLKLRPLLEDSSQLATIVASILECNYVQVYDEVTLSKKIKQTNGVLQGNSISPVLFNIMTADIVDITKDSATSIIMYADDMVLGSPNKEELQ